MKKLFFMLFLLVILVGCEFTPITKPNVPTEDEETTTEPTEPEVTVWDSVKFEDASIEYDGERHSLEVTGLPEGAEVTYFPKSGEKYPGNHKFEATVTINGETKRMSATLTITKAAVTITADSEQTAYLTDGPASVKYSSNHEINVEQELFIEPGVYEVSISTPETSTFLASNEVIVTLTVLESKSGLYLVDDTLIVNGSDSISTEVASYGETSVDNYTIIYNNCTYSEQGIYHASAEVYDKENGEFIETLRAVVKVDYVDDTEFATYADEMFVYLFGGDQMSTNIFLINPENFGVEHSDAIYYTYEPFTEEEWNSDKAEIERLFEELATFNDNMLSYNQLNTKRVIYETLMNYKNVYDNMDSFFMDVRYIDQYGGYCANIPTYLEAYALRNEQDIKDVISYIESTYTAFMSYIEYVYDREEHGYGYSIFTLEKMQEYLDGVAMMEDGEPLPGNQYALIKPEDYYVYPILNEKIQKAGEVLGLSNEVIANYQTALYNAFKDQYIPAHHDLSEAIGEYLVVSTAEGGYLEQVDGEYVSFKEGYLPNYDGGKEYYEQSLKDTLGVYDMSMEEIIAYLDEVFTESLKKFMDYARQISFGEQMILDGVTDIFGTKEPLEIIEHLKEFAKTIVPDLAGDPIIDVTYMDKTVTANTTTLAYYMKSPLDGTLNEYIHLNGDAIRSNVFETAMTLAHEGYPGHLYAYVNTKENPNLHNINRVFTCTGHGEGWAKYVEYALGNYLVELKGTKQWENAINYNNYYSLFAYTMQTRLDIGINYEGWSVSDVESFLSKNLLNAEIAQDLYYSCIEAPGQIATYGFGMARFVDYHIEAKEVLGVYFDEVDFNAMLLSNGWCSLSTLDKMVDEYIDNKAFVYNLSV